jgi:hypothetical protein
VNEPNDGTIPNDPPLARGFERLGDLPRDLGLQSGIGRERILAHPADANLAQAARLRQDAR